MCNFYLIFLQLLDLSFLISLLCVPIFTIGIAAPSGVWALIVCSSALLLTSSKHFFIHFIYSLKTTYSLK